MTQDASDSAEGRAFLALLKWVRVHEGGPLSVVAWTGGPLVKKFRRLGRVLVVHRPVRFWRLRALIAELPDLKGKFTGLRIRLWFSVHPRFETVYLDGAGAITSLRYMIKKPDVVVLRLRGDGGELATTLRPHEGNLLDLIDRFMVPMPEAERRLVDDLGVDASKITIQPAFVDLETDGVATARPRKLRDVLDIGPDERIIVGAGPADWRHGPDLLVQVAVRVLHTRPSRRWHFVWVGDDPFGALYWPIRHDIRHASLDDRVHLISSATEDVDPFSDADIYAIVAREAASTTAMLEAVGLGVPVVAFDSTAARAAVGDQGRLVPFLDVESMADTIVQLLDDDRRLDLLREATSKRIRLELDATAAAPRILKQIESATSSR